jgi:hypothetical protein
MYADQSATKLATVVAIVVTSDEMNPVNFRRSHTEVRV